MDAIAGNSQLAKGEGRGKFIPVRKEDLFSALIKQGDFSDTAECELFRRFARTLRNICHYEYSETLDRLREDYYYFSPEIAGLASTDRAKSNCAYDDLIRSLDKVLKDANFEELPHEEVALAHRKRTVTISARCAFTNAAATSSSLRLANGLAYGGARSRLKCSTTSCFSWR